MPYKENVKRRTMKNKEKVKAQKKSEECLRVVLTPLTGPVFEACLQRLRRRQREQGLEKTRERRKRWWKANPEKVREQKKRWWERKKESPEAVNERSRRYYRTHKEQHRETHEKWLEANKDRVRAHAR